MSLRVVVTRQDIAAGMARDCSRCPIGLAIARSGHAAGIPLPDGTKPHRYAFIEREFFHVGPYSGRLPEQVVAFIHRFDRGEPVEPIQFDLPVPTGPGRPLGRHEARRRRPGGRFDVSA